MKKYNFQRTKQAGLTLIELMIGTTLGLIITAGVLNVFVSTLKGSKDILEQARLEQEMNAIMLIMSNDIRRAGYWGPNALTADYVAGDQNPFFSGVDAADNSDIDRRLKLYSAADWTDAQTLTVGTSSSGTCIVYTYNVDDDAFVGVGGSDTAPYGPTATPFTNAAVYDDTNLEMFGFRWKKIDDVGVIQMRSGMGGAGVNTFSCSSGTSNWEGISDNDLIDISNFSFTVTPALVATITSSTLQIQSWTVRIDMTGVLKGDTSVTKTLSTTVKLANTVVVQP